MIYIVQLSLRTLGNAIAKYIPSSKPIDPKQAIPTRTDVKSINQPAPIADSMTNPLT